MGAHVSGVEMALQPEPWGSKPVPELPPYADSWENSIEWCPDWGACSSGVQHQEMRVSGGAQGRWAALLPCHPLY